MVAIHCIDRGTRRSRPDWRAGAVVVLVHALVIVWLLRSPIGEPLRASLSPMILVELWNSASDTRAPAQAAVKPDDAKAAPSRSRKAVASPTGRAQRPTEPSVVRSTGTQAIDGSVAAHAILADSSAVEGSTNGSGTALTGTSGSGGHFHPPRVLQRVRPRYPADAFAAGRTGSVDVLVTVAADGTPIDARVQQSSGTPSLDEAAVRSVRSWTFRAAEKGDRPIEAQAIVTLDWAIGPATVTDAMKGSEPAPARATANPRVVQGCLIQHRSSPELCKS